jgi:hypothetical protein
MHYGGSVAEADEIKEKDYCTKKQVTLCAWWAHYKATTEFTL